MENNIYTKKVNAGSRTYFFDVKLAKSGSKYLVISESTSKGKSRVFVFDDHMDEFFDALVEVKEQVKKKDTR